MSDPRTILTERLEAAVVAAFGAEHARLDPMVRRSERADYQADLAMALGKALKLAPREVAAALVAKLDLHGIGERVEIAGPGFINIILSRDFLERETLALAGERRPGGGRAARPPAAGRAASREPRQGDPRLLGAQRREGDARRPPALDDHRRCARPNSRGARPGGRTPTPRHRVGH